jgi:hypothetical protein
VLLSLAHDAHVATGLAQRGVCRRASVAIPFNFQMQRGEKCQTADGVPQRRLCSSVGRVGALLAVSQLPSACSRGQTVRGEPPFLLLHWAMRVEVDASTIASFETATLDDSSRHARHKEHTS